MNPRDRKNGPGAGALPAPIPRREIPLVVRWASEGRADATAFLNRWLQEAPADWTGNSESDQKFLQEWLRKERAR